MNISNILKENRPQLSDTSIKTYKSNIKKTLDIVGKEFNDLNDIDEHFEEIFNVLNEYKFNIRKTKMSSFIVLMDTPIKTKERVKMLDRLRDVMYEDTSRYNKKEVQQEMSEKQKKNFVEWTDVLKVQKQLERIAKPFFKVSKLRKKDWNVLVDYVLISCYTLIPPRRSKDYSAFKIRDFDTNKDNYMYSTKKNKKTESFFVFNQYKNSSRLGRQEIQIPSKLANIIKKWMKINTTPHLIPTYSGMPVSQVKINQIISRIFPDKSVGTSLLRHSYLTHHYQDVDLSKLKEDTKNMGNSQIERSLKYVQKTDINETNEEEKNED